MTALDQRIIDNMPKEVHQIVVAAYMGSTSHGTTIHKEGSIDDVDITGIFIPDARHVIGLQTMEHWDPKVDETGPLGELDCTFFALRKIVQMWLKSNPNVMPLLWVNPDHIITTSPTYRTFRIYRTIFNSMEAYRALRGYARGQMHDIDKGQYKGYMGAKRKENVIKFGYDTKHASHTIRLLRMGIEFLQTGGTYTIDRTGIDATQLIAIKQGEWTRAAVLSLADSLLVKLDEEALSKPLPDEPDRKTAEDIMMQALYNSLKETDLKYG